MFFHFQKTNSDHSAPHNCCYCWKILSCHHEFIPKDFPGQRTWLLATTTNNSDLDLNAYVFQKKSIYWNLQALFRKDMNQLFYTYLLLLHKNLAEDLHICPVLECRNPVQLCLVIVCPTKREGKQRPKFLVRIPL